MARRQLRSFNFPDHFIRHRDFLGELTPLSTELDMQDSLFNIVPGLADSDGVSLESVNFPNHFLRHQDFRLKLHNLADPNDGLFRADATFYRVRGFADPDGVSYRSFNFPDHYIRHRDFHLFVEPENSPNLAADATFFQQQPPQRID